jgi:hypothetical protein
VLHVAILSATLRSSAAVVIGARGDTELVIDDLVDETVFVGDSVRPEPVEAMFERFGLPDPRAAMPLDVLDEEVDSLEALAILRLPPDVVVPTAVIPGQGSFKKVLMDPAAGLQSLDRGKESLLVLRAAQQVRRLLQGFVVIQRDDHNGFVDV